MAREPRIVKLRRIVDGHTAGRVDGVTIDVLTASMLVAVYEALGPESRMRFDDPPIARLVAFGWKHTTIGGAR